jgi:TRAP-type C4-dicarboxylate transport system substrate-binding protein
MADDIKKIIKETAKETAKEVAEQTKRHFDVMAEDLKSTITQVAEGVDINSQVLQRLSGMPDEFEKIHVRLDSIEGTLEAVNLPALKQKVLTLEKRISLLEAKAA